MAWPPNQLEKWPKTRPESAPSLSNCLPDLGLDERVPNHVAVSIVDFFAFFFLRNLFPGAAPPAGREAVNAPAVGPEVALVLGGPLAEVAPEPLPAEVHRVDVGPEDLQQPVGFAAVVAHVVLAIWGRI